MNGIDIAQGKYCLKDCQKEKDELDIFEKDLGTFVRFYEFMSQIIGRLNEIFVAG